VAHEYHFPMLVPGDLFAQRPFLATELIPADIVVDRIVSIGPDVPAGDWNAYYESAVRSLKPGVTEFVVHLAHDDEEMRAATPDRATWDSAWRQRDYNVLASAEFRHLLQENHVTLISWRELRRSYDAARPASTSR